MPEKESKKKRRTRKEADPPILLLLRAFVGPIFVIGGWQVMQFSFWPGLAIVYFGFCLSLAECIWEPALLRRPYQLQVFLIGLVVLLFAVFTIAAFPVLPVIAVDSYATLGNYASETELFDVKWDSAHWEDLRLNLYNQSNYDFTHVDLYVVSDLWIHAAVPTVPGSDVKMSLVNANGLITSVSIDGSPPIPVGTDLSAPNRLRIRCDDFPKHSSINLMLILINYKHAVRGALPEYMWETKRLPKWVNVRGEYVVLGKVGKVNITNTKLQFFNGEK